MPTGHQLRAVRDDVLSVKDLDQRMRRLKEHDVAAFDQGYVVPSRFLNSDGSLKEAGKLLKREDPNVRPSAQLLRDVHQDLQRYYPSQRKQALARHDWYARQQGYVPPSHYLNIDGSYKPAGRALVGWDPGNTVSSVPSLGMGSGGMSFLGWVGVAALGPIGCAMMALRTMSGLTSTSASIHVAPQYGAPFAADPWQSFRGQPWGNIQLNYPSTFNLHLSPFFR